MKKTALALLAGVIILPIAVQSCNILDVQFESWRDREALCEATMTLRVSTPEGTKSEVALKDDEKTLTSLTVFVFRAEGSPEENLLDICKSADRSLLALSEGSYSMTLNSTTGPKHIYVLANDETLEKELSSKVVVESDILGAVSEFTANSRGSLAMVGSGSNQDGYEPTLVAGLGAANNIDVSLRRLVGRIIVGNIIGDFESPSLAASQIRVRRVFLLNAAKRVPAFNGDYTDVLGAWADSPEGFLKAQEAPHYYHFDAPVPGNGENGVWNYVSAQDALAGKVELSERVGELTIENFSLEEGLLYNLEGDGKTPLQDHTLPGDRYFYALPNSSAPSEDQEIRDETVKFVVEVGIKTSSASTEEIYYYPIKIPYLQPNYSYRINSIRLRRLGSKDPNIPVTLSDCSFSLSIAKWYSGDISGQYNNSGNNSDFEM